MMIWGLGTDIIIGLLTAVLLSVMITEEYALHYQSKYQIWTSKSAWFQTYPTALGFNSPKGE